MEPAPYGGFMTRTIAGENEQKELLARQAAEVDVGGVSETLRPDAVHIRGVDNLSTEEIEAFVDLYLNVESDGPEYRRQDEPVWFRVQWVDDSSANVLFKTHADSLRALQRLSEQWPAVENTAGGPDAGGPAFSAPFLAALVEERRARPYAAAVPYHQHRQQLKELADGQDLFQAKKAELEEQKQSAMDEDGSPVVLHVRQALQSDRKVKNAAAYSRYYLLHGEPDRTRPRVARRGGEARGRGTYARAEDDGEDLFAAKIKSGAEAGLFAEKDLSAEEDLFAARMREQSPGRK
ncbi:hypothetical protein METBIDRAFT_45826 [Metschnikowia bicuspidata var. bicuspidata NRRL YB-4993]|uniref:Uncharacterized protein n=1 Tax=Metschnikowia bicuspidata var. bicuspidata NRRL YB-4993 TaxID=869754 RepID=A0A1A0H6K0_9ASCO|nr:hypothetical protein METBIDRAFT_45826 [Metschnikowia bicuspidata var. bicuspidata NRRL YB-4993]OBA19538.1 hypothetical protein METBIDRAFT_45826 [Metschnikowia bicuspidata var. bicuspidata NRRL YB-4993]